MRHNMMMPQLRARVLCQSSGFMKFGYNRGWETTMYLSHNLSKGLHTIMSKTLMPNYEHTAELVFFKLFESSQFHDYLNLVRFPKYKYYFIKLWLKSHRLAVEKGRWNKPHPIPLEERKCSFSTSLESGFHFLFECKLHNGIRKTFIPRYYWNRPNIPNN